MSKISPNLREALKQLNPNMVLHAKGSGRHKPKYWIEILPYEWLRTRATVQSNIYNEGRIEITAKLDIEGTRSTHYLMFHQVPLTEFTKKHQC